MRWILPEESHSKIKSFLQKQNPGKRGALPGSECKLIYPFCKINNSLACESPGPKPAAVIVKTLKLLKNILLLSCRNSFSAIRYIHKKSCP